MNGASRSREDRRWGKRGCRCSTSPGLRSASRRGRGSCWQTRQPGIQSDDSKPSCRSSRAEKNGENFFKEQFLSSRDGFSF